MGQFCFCTRCVDKKRVTGDCCSTVAKKQGSEVSTKELDFFEFEQLDSSAPAVSEHTKERGLPYCKTQENESFSDVSVLDSLAFDVSTQTIHKQFQFFPGIFAENTAALTLRSCEGADMPNRLVVAGEDGDIAVIDHESGEVTRRWSGAHERDVNCLTRPLSSGIFASASRDKLVKVWNLSRDEVLCELRGHTVNVTSVTMGLDGVFLVSGSRDNTVRLWDIERAEELQCCDIKQNVVHFVQWVHRLNCVAQGGEDLTLRLWDVRMNFNGKNALGMSLDFVSTCMDYYPVCCELLPNSSGDVLLTGHNGFNGHGAYVLEWDLRMRKRLRTFCGHRGTVRSVRGCTVPLRLGHRQIVSAGDDGIVAFFLMGDVCNEPDATVEPEKTLTLPEGPVTCLESCANGDVVASTRGGALLVLRPKLSRTGGGWAPPH